MALRENLKELLDEDPLKKSKQEKRGREKPEPETDTGGIKCE